VEEQVAGGDAEPAPTPAEGVEEKVEEVVEPGGLEKVDELVEEAKVAEETQDKAQDTTPEIQEQDAEGNRAPSIAKERPQVEEVNKEESVSGVASDAESTAAPVDEREQQRLENPIYTLEVVGNRYNPSNFW
jgi:capping protein alpha